MTAKAKSKPSPKKSASVTTAKLKVLKIGDKPQVVSYPPTATYRQIADKLGMTNYVFAIPETGTKLEMASTVREKVVIAVPNVKDGGYRYRLFGRR